MAEDAGTNLVFGAAPLITRAQDFKIFYANFFRLRLGPGDCAITFATATDVPMPTQAAPSNPPGMMVPQVVNIVQEDMAVALSWPVLKTLAQHLNEMVQAIEGELGPIKSMKSLLTHDQAVGNYRQIIRQNLVDS